MTPDERRNLYAWSECFVQPETTRYEQHEGYKVIRTVERPGYWFGNFIRLDRRPDAADEDRLLAQWNTVFPQCEIEHILYEWIVETVDDDALLRPGFSWKGARYFNNIALLAQSPLLNRRGRLPADYELRACAGQEWRRLIELVASNDYAQAEWSIWRYGHYKRACEAGDGTCFLVWNGGEIVGYASLYWRGGIFRFQDVWVAPEIRRVGVGSALCAALAGLAFTRVRCPTVVISAERDSAGYDLYRSLGFKPFASQYAIFALR